MIKRKVYTNTLLNYKKQKFYKSNYRTKMSSLITIGRVQDKEIDFIASKNNKISYYQVTYLLASQETINREFDVYKQVTDNYPKYVLSLDQFNFSKDGIIHKNLIDFLLEE